MRVFKFKKFDIRITPRKRDFLVVVLWTSLMVLVMVNAHRTLYLKPRFRRSAIPWSPYEPPSLSAPEMLILLAASLLVTLTLSDVKSLIYGSIASLAVSFIIAVAYASLYIWFILDWQTVFSMGPYDWEIVVHFALMNMFWVMFPWVVGLSVVGIVFGFFVRGWLYM